MEEKIIADIRACMGYKRFRVQCNYRLPRTREAFLHTIHRHGFHAEFIPDRLGLTRDVVVSIMDPPLLGTLGEVGYRAYVEVLRQGSQERIDHHWKQFLDEMMKHVDEPTSHHHLIMIGGLPNADKASIEVVAHYLEPYSAYLALWTREVDTSTYRLCYDPVLFRAAVMDKKKRL